MLVNRINLIIKFFIYNVLMDFKELIKDKNLKFTPAREAILEIFSNASKPLSYEDIKDKLKMDKATFYRNMTTFEHEGIISGFESTDKKKYYELSKTLHAHFICSKCQTVKCLEDDLHLSLQKYSIDKIILHGSCPECL
jgi:Fur family transcriptional regulator, ferric uptake regulator